MKKRIYPKNTVSHVVLFFTGEKNGKNVGLVLNIVQKDVVETKKNIANLFLF